MFLSLHHQQSGEPFLARSRLLSQHPHVVAQAAVWAEASARRALSDWSLRSNTPPTGGHPGSRPGRAAEHAQAQTGRIHTGAQGHFSPGPRDPNSRQRPQHMYIPTSLLLLRLLSQLLLMQRPAAPAQLPLLTVLLSPSLLPLMLLRLSLPRLTC